MKGAGETTKNGKYKLSFGGTVWMAWVKDSQQKWGKNAFGVSFLGEGRIIWQCQNYHIKLSMWTLVTMSYTKEILGRVFKCSLTSFPQSPPRGGVDFRQNCNTEISGVNVSVQKKIPLILVHFIT